MALYDVSTTEKKAAPSLVAGGTLYADSPIGTILPYGGASAPSGWFLCDGTAISRTTFSELFAVIGESFGAGDGSTTFNVPDMRGKFAEGLASGDTLGTNKSAGLPNITGYFNADDLHHGGGVFNGAFKGFAHAGANQQLANGSGAYDNNSIVFDASKSNAIYGASNTVQPPAVCVNYIIKAKMVALPSDLEAGVDEKIAPIEAVIPSDASASNKLVDDKRFSGVRSNVDCNTLTTAGVYSTAGANVPESGFWFMIVVQYGYINATEYIMQLAYSVADTSKTYRRVSSDGGSTWSVWNRIITQSDLTSSVTSGSTAPLTSQGCYSAIPVMNFTFESSNTLVLNMSSTAFRKVCIYNDSEYYEFVVHEWGSNASYHWIVGTALPSTINASYANYGLTLTTTHPYRVVIEAPDGRTAIRSYT